MATKVVINALINKYAETKGEVFTITENLAEKRNDLQALETSMRLLGRNVSVESIKPKHKRKFNAKLPIGTIPMLGGEYIRERIAISLRAGPIATNIAISVLNYFVALH